MTARGRPFITERDMTDACLISVLAAPGASCRLIGLLICAFLMDDAPITDELAWSEAQNLGWTRRKWRNAMKQLTSREILVPLGNGEYGLPWDSIRAKGREMSRLRAEWDRLSAEGVSDKKIGELLGPAYEAMHRMTPRHSRIKSAA